jgi:hypothetical protein
MKKFNDVSKEKARKSALKGKGASDWMQAALQSKFEVIFGFELDIFTAVL